MIPNLWLLAQLLFKVLWMTGIGPAFVAIGLWEFICRAERSQKRKLHLVPHTSWGGVRRRGDAVRVLAQTAPQFLQSHEPLLKAVGWVPTHRQ
jgi:hypothetical protein